MPETKEVENNSDDEIISFSTVVAEKDKVVYFHTLEGLHTGTFMDIYPTGNRVKATGFTMVKIANNKVIERWYETNLLEVMEQIGVISRDN